jgi:hypothetical protein
VRAAVREQGAAELRDRRAPSLVAAAPVAWTSGARSASAGKVARGSSLILASGMGAPFRNWSRAGGPRGGLRLGVALLAGGGRRGGLSG